MSQRLDAAEEQLYETLVKEILPRVVAFIAARLGNHHDAEDLAMGLVEEFLRADERGKSMNAQYMAAWFYRAANYRLVDLWRRRKRSEGIVVPLEEVSGLGYQVDFLGKEDEEEDKKPNEDLQRLYRGMQKLSQRDQLVVRLKYECRWSSKQIGEELGLKPGAVRKILDRVRLRLKKEFEN